MIKVDGACHCGQIRFEAEIGPDRVRTCHCTDCQTLSGSAFRVSAPTAEANFRLLSGFSVRAIDRETRNDPVDEPVREIEAQSSSRAQR